MFNKLFKTTYNNLSFEDVQHIIKNPIDYIIINTLPTTKQHCLIKNTIPYQTEENTINDYINNYDFESKTFVIYGENANDEKIETKYSQLKSLGFTKLYLYRGGMFEWLLLQDIYGADEFPTTSRLLDILQYRPMRMIV